eukprot:CAMPEP_0114324554 /NCGR_PEP_ID=MMETSP0059-20121206/28580_1 /TAXON_ID=36894 /ORGANISM="Pyramimonas parkeae, Strain CCMP726" /LENGTH=44 /DNA_ID= /DNA_START= /DNA_END= /DNA_ORIENTATION=
MKRLLPGSLGASTEGAMSLPKKTAWAPPGSRYSVVLEVSLDENP